MRISFALLGAAFLLSPTIADARAQPSGLAQGKWANPQGTLAVETKPCGPGLCGAIVWASQTALADARDAGVEGLVGTQLLQDYRQTSSTSWTGRVYVPDMGRTFSSRIKQTNANTLTISGCLIGGFICKSQVWHRVP